MNPENSPTIYALVFSLIGAIGQLLIEFIKRTLPENKKEEPENSDDQQTDIGLLGPDGSPLRKTLPPTRSKRRKMPKALRIAIAIMSIPVLGFVGYEIGQNVRNGIFELPDFGSPSVTATPDDKPLPEKTPTPFPTPTPIGKGELQTEINFAQIGEGACNDYDVERLGYEDQKYYINPKSQSGYIAVCHGEGNLEPEGTLQVSAYPESDPGYYGFGVLFGWEGGDRSTTDACIVGVRRYGAYQTTEAVFLEANDNEWTRETLQLADVRLSNEPSTLRVTLDEDGWAQAYFNNSFIGDYRFENCKKGPIGLIAWNLQDGKIYFDDLKIYSLP